jgi:hypothetical protein|tara:strand:- start:243 stop:455 length:213 start_codon:yes stop_codon:yes gene_type:complete
VEVVQLGTVIQIQEDQAEDQAVEVIQALVIIQEMELNQVNQEIVEHTDTVKEVVITQFPTQVVVAVVLLT